MYSNNASLIFHFNEYHSFTDLRNAIAAATFPRGPRLNTSAALEFVRAQVFAGGRGDVPHVLVVTSASQSVGDVSSNARQLHNDGVSVISVGLGNDVTVTELNQIASDPDVDHVFTIQFEHMDTVEGAVAGMVIRGT